MSVSLLRIPNGKKGGQFPVQKRRRVTEWGERSEDEEGEEDEQVGEGGDSRFLATIINQNMRIQLNFLLHYTFTL